VLAAYAGTPGRPFTFLTEIGFISGASWATGDLSHLAFTTTETGVEGAPNVAKELVGNELIDVSVPPAGGDPFCGAQIGEFVGPGEGEPSARNAVSPDGSRIFFTGTPCGGTQRVYVREDATTTELSASACTRVDCNLPSDVVYHGASKDGSTVLMSSAQQLTDDDTNQSWDVYSVDVESGDLTRLSVDPVDPTIDTRAEDSWITGYSEDAGTVYFVAEGVLAVGATDGQKNLYVSRDGLVTFIATLDSFDFEARSGHPTGAYVTPSGDHLAFMTSNNLLPEDTDTLNQTNDVYLYDAEANTLTFASPGADGGTGVELPDPGANGRGLTNTVSEDGSSVILFSADRISPEDANFEYDLYEFANGQVSLVSGGKANQIAAPIFIGATPNGSDVFFTTNEELVAADTGDRRPGDRGPVRPRHRRREGGRACRRARCAPRGGVGSAADDPAGHTFAATDRGHRPGSARLHAEPDGLRAEADQCDAHVHAGRAVGAGEPVRRARLLEPRVHAQDDGRAHRARPDQAGPPAWPAGEAHAGPGRGQQPLGRPAPAASGRTRPH
jgi:Tol biopolymer transport system component